MTRGERAAQNFSNGCNCAQAVFLAFSDLTGMEEATAVRLTSGFGGGMGRLREVCGAVTGAFMVIGLLYGSSEIPSHEEKCALYGRIQEFADRFRRANGTYLCRELLDGVAVDKSAHPEARTPEYYRRRPCGELVRCAAELLEDYLRENPTD